MRGVLIDLDGVIWEGDQVVPGAPQAIDWLRTHDIPYLFVTNTTSRPVRLIADKLNQLGVPASTNQILTPPVAALAWLLWLLRPSRLARIPEQWRRTPVVRLVAAVMRAASGVLTLAIVVLLWDRAAAS